MQFLTACSAALVLVTMAAPSFADDYEQGLRFHQSGNFAASLPLFRRTAEQGDARGQFALAFVYAVGQGVAQDYLTAHKWAALAEAMGHEDAGNFRILIEKHLSPQQLAQARAHQSADASKPKSKPIPATVSVEQSVFASLEAWRAAWSRRDSAAYLAAYAPDFKVPDGLTRAQWEARRGKRLARPTRIEVRTEHPSAEIAADSSVAIRFTQYYASNLVRGSVTKTLVFGNYDGNWLIREETSTPIRK